MTDKWAMIREEAAAAKEAEATARQAAKLAAAQPILDRMAERERELQVAREAWTAEHAERVTQANVQAEATAKATAARLWQGTPEAFAEAWPALWAAELQTRLGRDLRASAPRPRL